jgi:hypothetical protein
MSAMMTTQGASTAGRSKLTGFTHLALDFSARFSALSILMIVFVSAVTLARSILRLIHNTYTTEN